EPQVVIKRKACLIEQTVGPGAARLPGRIKSDTSFSHPHDKRAGSRGEGDGRVADPRTWLKHQTSESPDRNVRAHSLLIHDDEGAIENVELALFHKHYGGALLYRCRTRRCQAGQAGSVCCDHRRLLINMRPHPKALALPNPLANVGKNKFGVSIVMSPSRS